MTNIPFLGYRLAIATSISCMLVPSLNYAESANTSALTAEVAVPHIDPITEEAGLSLSQLVTLTMEKFPDMTWLNAMEAEAEALRQRGESLVAGASQAGLRFQEATSGTLHYIDATVQVPLWNLGQRAAEQATGAKASISVQKQQEATQLRVAGLIRGALWDMALQNLRYQQAQEELQVNQKLFDKVKRRVELGDLPRADQILAETELLQKKSLLIQAEAELMHARKRYTTITQSPKVPSQYQESLSTLREVPDSHPFLLALNSQIDRKRAEIHALQMSGSGQTNVVVGINSDSFTNDPRSNKTESFNIGVNVPFGGDSHSNVSVAAVNVEMNKLIAEREQFYRDLQQQHHEAEHNLEVNKAELANAEKLRALAEQHLSMTEQSFAAGEIDLIDLLKIQSRAQLAILNAKERAVMLLRDQALYNQAVGVMP